MTDDPTRDAGNAADDAADAVGDAATEAADTVGDAASDDDGDITENAKRFSDGYGLDAVVLTASTSSHDPLALAMDMCRRKGRVVVEIGGE